MKRCEFVFPINITDKRITVDQYEEHIKTPLITSPHLKFFDAQKFINYIHSLINPANHQYSLRTFPWQKDYGFTRTFMSFIQEEGGRSPLPPNKASPEVYDSIKIFKMRGYNKDALYHSPGNFCLNGLIIGNFYFTARKPSNECCEEMVLKMEEEGYSIPKGEYKIKVASEENKPIISTYILRDLRFKQEDLSKVLPLDKILYDHVLR